MDSPRFDALTRSLAAAKTRRGLLGGLAALAAGLLGARVTDAQFTQVYCGNQFCASSPGSCKPGCVCCVYTNSVGQVTNSRCRPPGTCAPGTQIGGPTTTTTAAPTTTTTTTTAPTTTSTTAAPRTLQGTCPAGASSCGPGEVGCNDTAGCVFDQTTTGATVCRGSGQCSVCTVDSDCGAGRFCLTGCTGCSSGTVCAPRCPA